MANLDSALASRVLDSALASRVLEQVEARTADTVRLMQEIVLIAAARREDPTIDASVDFVSHTASDLILATGR